MPMRKKKFILALQPHEAITNHGDAWSPMPARKTLAFSMALIMLVGLAFPAQMGNPDEWRAHARVELLKIAYGWQTNQIIGAGEARQIYSRFWAKPLKTGCQGAPAQDWRVFCPVLNSQMGNGMDCDNANPASKAEILKNLQTSRGSSQYACLYGN